MLRALLFCLALGLVLAPGASAAPEIQLIDTTTGARHTLLRGWHLLRVPDNTGAIAERRGRVVRVDFADRRITPLPHLSLETLWAYGPHGETFDFVPRASGRTSLTLREPGGGALASYDFGVSWSEPVVAWSPDGTRAALAVARQLRVVDLATGGLLLERTFGEDLGMTRQPFSPDSAALVLAEGGKILRVDVPSGAATELFRDDAARRPSASWSEVGPIVVNDGWDVRLLDQPGVPVRTGRDRLSRVGWDLNGTALSYTFAGRLDDCRFPNQGLAAVVPGQRPRVLLPPAHREVFGWGETPDGRLVAVDLHDGENRRPDLRGKRHPWPKRIPRGYGMSTRRDDAAVRRVVIDAARRLRRGTSRHVTLIHVRNEFRALGAVSGRDPGAVSRSLTRALNPWLRAAGFRRIHALAELDCGRATTSRVPAA